MTVTVSATLVTGPSVAVMEVTPSACAVTIPWVPAALETVATAPTVVAQVTLDVMFWVVPSLKVPVAVNWIVGVVARDNAGSTGVIAMEAREAVTVDTDEPVMVPDVAEMVVVPPSLAVRMPVVLTVATAVFDDVQVTPEVSACFVPSEKVPVATSCVVAPGGRFAVETLIDLRFALKINVVDPVIVEGLSVGSAAEDAVMVVLPAPTVVITPVVSMVATFVLEDVQPTRLVTSRTDPSE